MVIRKRFLFRGSVQGVGFRPFLWRQARDRRLGGFVRNRADGVLVEVEGAAGAVADFLAAVEGSLPPRARITGIAAEEIPPEGAAAFVIAASEPATAGELHIPPDTAVCDACLAELFDPADRRYRYPFINCTDCGPRLTIIRGVPYDRHRTAMACFPLCARCQAEYEDPGDRRFHAEPNACPDCGPRLALLDAGGAPLPGDPVAGARERLRRGQIVALKGLGGFHLCVDPCNDAAVATLRVRKFREEKPLALMVRNLATAARLVRLGPDEAALLRSPERPIVLMARRGKTPLSPRVAPGVETLGLMLPYTPLHHLLLDADLPVLVMTSANRTDEPICIGNREALHRLAGIADAFLLHDRDILVRCDDSVAAVVAGTAVPLRRSRGYAPAPVPLRRGFPEVLALGAQEKNTLCLLRGPFAFLSPHIGDVETPEARDFLAEGLALLERITECRPRLVACDLHPGYHTTRLARSLEGREVVGVQHHHAHVVSCMAENHLAGEVIGLAMDGTGYGSDGQAWGGEFLVAGEAAFRRAGHLRYLPLPGGARAVREPWRMAAILLRAAFGSDWRGWARRLELVPPEAAPEPEALLEGLHRTLEGARPQPLTSSLGRLFDGVAALLGLHRRVSFEAQAAMALEALAGGARTGPRLPFALQEEGPTGGFLLDLSPAFAVLAEARAAGHRREELAMAFHRLLPEAFTAAAGRLREERNLQRVVLSGGCFQNRRLLTESLAALRRAGFEVFHHRLVPANDGGISLGQAVCAGAQQIKEP